MRLSQDSPTKQAIIETLLPFTSEHYWYHRYANKEITVTDSTDEEEYYVVSPEEFAGNHILKSDVKDL